MTACKTFYAKMCILGCCGLFNGARAIDLGATNDIAAVSARASKDYIRTRKPDGAFTSETYAFAEGGNWSGALADYSIDKLNFLKVAHVIAYPLANQNYIPSKEPKATKLLIMVYWGTTHAPEHASDSSTYNNLSSNENAIKAAQMTLTPPPIRRSATTVDPRTSPTIAAMQEQESTLIAAAAAENRIREQDDHLNANMLGYDSWWEESQGDHRGTALEQTHQDLLDEIEQNRYFVVLMAYDFQLLYREKKHKLLWETRFSIRQRNHEFDKDLPSMAQYASQYFGQDSHGLLHKEIPLGRVDIGQLKSLGDVEEPAK